MATNWIDGTTPVNATNLNDIENRLSALETSSEGTPTWFDDVTENSWIYRNGNVVYIIMFRRECEFTGGTSENLAIVPEGFRPSSIRRIGIIMNSAAASGYFYFATINSSGQIRQSVTSTTISRMLIFGTYFL